ncbi:dnaJ homolog subfamily C member 4-like [Apostichopus japonicus]|uniref:dnaJ homolog subfamily C member 4-like n=1 Tax=Stichopus japonicus TaxID=307972 RepID=UPI003AB7BA6C
MKQFILCNRCWNLLQIQLAPSKTFSVAAVLSRPENYYQLLKVPKNAELSEIKAAYIELSKALHPDKNPDKPNQHDKFVEVNKAYEVLSKPLSRRDYDETLITGRPVATNTRVYRSDNRDPFGASTGGTGWYNDFAYASTESPEGARNYYGIKGVNRVGNTFIMYGCIAFLFATGVVLFTIFKQSSNYAIRRLDAKDQRIAEMYNEAKSKLRENGNKKQMEIMRQRHKEFQRRRAENLNAQK